MARISFVVVGETIYQITAYLHYQVDAKSKQWNCLKQSCSIGLLISLVINSAPTLWHPWLLLSSIWLTFCHLHEKERVSILSMSHFLEIDLREQQNYEKRIQTSVDNKVNDLRHEIKFEKHLSFSTFGKVFL